jgi:polyribonucleotide nucleotidyltransferase
MDFKVAGTREFVTAIQLDTKLTGVPSEVLAGALDQAKAARLSILDLLEATIPEARSEVSEHAPRIITIQIPVEKIGEVIGPKGKVIQEIQAETGAEIDIQDDGRVFIASRGSEGAEAARVMIDQIANPVLPEPGMRFEGKIVGVNESLGLFVRVPGSQKDGLCHISKLGFGDRLETLGGKWKTGDLIEVEVQKVDEVLGKISLSPIHPETGEPYHGPERGQRSDRDRGPRRDGDRGPRGDGDRGPRRDDSRGAPRRRRREGEGSGPPRND